MFNVSSVFSFFLLVEFKSALRRFGTTKGKILLYRCKVKHGYGIFFILLPKLEQVSTIFTTVALKSAWRWAWITRVKALPISLVEDFGKRVRVLCIGKLEESSVVSLLGKLILLIENVTITWLTSWGKVKEMRQEMLTFLEASMTTPNDVMRN